MSSRKRLTLLQKREIIEIANKPGFNSKSRQKIAQDYGISQATISVILSKKSEILEKTDYMQGNLSNRNLSYFRFAKKI